MSTICCSMGSTRSRRARRSVLRRLATEFTFKACADKYIAVHRRGWRNLKHAAQWEATLKTHAEVVIGGVSVRDVDTNLVMKVLES